MASSSKGDSTKETEILYTAFIDADESFEEVLAKATNEESNRAKALKVVASLKLKDLLKDCPSLEMRSSLPKMRQKIQGFSFIMASQNNNCLKDVVLAVTATLKQKFPAEDLQSIDVQVVIVEMATKASLWERWTRLQYSFNLNIKMYFDLCAALKVKPVADSTIKEYL